MTPGPGPDIISTMSVGIVEKWNRDEEPRLLAEPWPDRLTWRDALAGFGLAGAVGAVSLLVHLVG